MRRRLLLALAALAVLVAASPLGFAWTVSSQMARPPWYEHRTPEQGLRPGHGTDPRADHGLDYEDVSFPAVDGSTLRGWLVPAPAPTDAAVVTVHGGGGDRRSFLGALPALHAAGYPVLLFDCREQGVSDGGGRGMSLGVRESADTRAAVRYLREERGLRRVAALGSSQGATSVILAAAADPGIDLVVAQGTGTTLFAMMRIHPALAPYPDWLLRLSARVFLWRAGAPWENVMAIGPGPHDVVDRIAPRPLLLIQGEHDEMAPAAQARANFARAGEPKQLWIVDGVGHRGVRSHDPAEWDRRVVGFLHRHLAP